MDSGRLIALKILSAPEGALIAALAPFIGAFMGYFFLHEKISVRKVIALCIGFSGILPGILGSSNVTVSSISASSIIPYLIAFFSVCGAVVSGTVIKLIKKRYQVPMLQTVSMGMMGGGAIAFLLSLYFESWTPVPFINSARALPIIAYLFLFHNLLAYPLYGYLVERYPLTLVSFAQLLIPFFTALFRWLFFSEMVTFSFVISFVILSGALYFFYLEDKKDNKNL
jgi:drug/metabolite transporter (DMT)-like permease